jgi:predicted AAA+ superfamily ATPase
MAKSNVEIVTTGLDFLLQGLRPYVLRELKSRFGERWWNAAVRDSLRGAVGGEARWAQLTDEERFDLLDVQAIFTVMNNTWNDVFQSQLGYAGRSYVSELREVRNSWAHQRAFTAEDAYRALDTMQRLLGMTGGEGQEELKKLSQELLRQRFEAETKRELKKSAAVTQTGALGGLKSWRQVATPHPDVASGRYQQAEFAADLFQVITGKAEPEYGDAKEFFRRTYLTEGLTRLLSRAWERLLGLGGDPVVELQTNFGGGKTHSMLALYHLFGGGSQLRDVTGLELLLPKNLANQEKVVLPKARRAVLVGTQISPADPRTKPDGTLVNTLWGEMAWQLGEAAGGKGAEAFALVVLEDREGISPGSEKLTRLFETYGPALVLIDEWVAYARQIYGKDGLPAGSFDSNMTFAHALTEAAKAARNALVVASIPASDIEIGGEGGRAALERIQNVFARVESVWKPATSTESFEIVRRRLFQPISDFAARDAVCRAFSEMYQSNRAEFPSECREASYEERLRSAYPIHPEFFDRLYEDWSTLDRFQRTRGVLRLMASIIHELWERQDGSLLIMPGLVPIDSTAVRFEITHYLPEGWGAVLDKDVDGATSRPLVLDRENPNLGRYSACRRVARTVFIGSAPSVTAQKARGVEEVRIKLGCVQPGETPAVFGDALRRLSEDLTYLYSDASRYWFDTHPTITRIASDRAAQYERTPHLVEDEIIRRVRASVGRERGEFAGVHAIPANSGDVPDEAEARLVILGPEAPHRARNGASKAQAAAQEILERRGNSPRIYRNMLVFLAADSERLEELGQAVRLWLAWTSILQEVDQLNLDPAQKRQVDNQVKKYEETIAARLNETYCHLIVPSQEGTGPVEWIYTRLQGSESLVERASRRLVRDEELITQWSPATLRIELDRWLWKDQDHLSTKQLWEYLASYLYLPRLRNEQVLVDAIRNGAGSLTWMDYFAYASAVREDGYYVGLVGGSLPNVILDGNSVLVKPEAAHRQREAERLKSEEVAYPPRQPVEGERQVPYRTGPGQDEVVAVEPGKTALRRFHGSVELDPMRLGRDAGRIADEVISHLEGLVGSDVKITLEVLVEVQEGIPENVVRIVSENCNTLKFKTHGFEE